MTRDILATQKKRGQANHFTAVSSDLLSFALGCLVLPHKGVNISAQGSHSSE